MQVRKTGSTSINRTFSLKSDAQFWAREKERELELEGYVKPNTELLSHRLIDLLSRYETEVARTSESKPIRPNNPATWQWPALATDNRNSWYN